MHDSGESVTEMQKLVNSLTRQSNAKPWEVWTLPDFSVIDDAVTIVPFSCDYMLSSCAVFITSGLLANRQSTRVMRLCGDATFGECSQGLKRHRLGFAGSHFSYNEWCATQIPLVDCVCHEECFDAVDLALEACAHLLDVRHGIFLADVVGEWFWDGHVGAINVLTEFFPQAKGHLCVEHAKRNIMKKTIEMLAFTTPMVFHVAAELVIEGCLRRTKIHRT